MVSLNVARHGLSIALLGMLLLVSGDAWADVKGIARVFDGDSIQVAGKRIELFGIDAPERGQTCRSDFIEWACGHAAARRLKELISSRRVTCRERGRDHNRRMIAQCYVDGFDIGRTMVKCGMALALPRNQSPYLRTEAHARRTGQGVWYGEVVELWIRRVISRRHR